MNMPDHLDSWLECLHLGIGRCESADMLTRYYLRWKDEIEAHEQRNKIIEWFGERKKELGNANA